MATWKAVGGGSVQSAVAGNGFGMVQDQETGMLAFAMTFSALNRAKADTKAGITELKAARKERKDLRGAIINSIDASRNGAQATTVNLAAAVPGTNVTFDWSTDAHMAASIQRRERMYALIEERADAAQDKVFSIVELMVDALTNEKLLELLPGGSGILIMALGGGGLGGSETPLD